MRRARRIIPARAGFTNRPGGRCCRAWDHPRSRGVYIRARLKARRLEGSSPLARGLRLRRWGGGRRRRIIPARAGFTVVLDRETVNIGDHPRSRGFTSRPRRSAHWRRDHPRSRGVYRKRWPYRSRRSGSSPLARGLRRTRLSRTARSRIIPARAGFTRGPGRWRRRAQDHPRSRGVYPTMNPQPALYGGSSPLARGLRSRRADPDWRPVDHPRSRGVYKGLNVVAFMAPGSSPLARGLLAQREAPRLALRIIPARAGFTA